MIDMKEDTEDLMPEFRNKVDGAQVTIEKINTNSERVQELKAKY
jgi:hypothetical protein